MPVKRFMMCMNSQAFAYELGTNKLMRIESGAEVVRASDFDALQERYLGATNLGGSGAGN